MLATVLTAFFSFIARNGTTMGDAIFKQLASLEYKARVERMGKMAQLPEPPASGPGPNAQ